MQRECDECGHCYTARRASSRFCGDTCGKRSQRARAAGIPILAATLDDREAPSELVQAVTRELEAAGRLRTAFGQVAVELARRIGSRRETGAATASLAKQFHATMTGALAGVAQVADAELGRTDVAPWCAGCRPDGTDGRPPS